MAEKTTEKTDQSEKDSTDSAEKLKNTATVSVRFKAGVLDPEGVTIQKSLAIMGYDKAVSVRAGKFYEVELADNSEESQKQLQELSEKVLANPVIESFEITWPA
ncbi:phosphoribosylformylglycinamidine synthase subunit PurS [Gemmatimonas aurantiaca]|nr:phosphoribosylformylglycinamidine synthase subunit PurS [Gemmatimonas aurantiaca]